MQQAYQSRRARSSGRTVDELTDLGVEQTNDLCLRRGSGLDCLHRRLERHPPGDALDRVRRNRGRRDGREQVRAKGHESRFSHGIRITDPIALDCAQEAAGQLRFEIEAAFSQGLPNTPMANSTVRVISGNFLTARPVGIVDGVDFMHSGVVRRVDAGAIQRTIDTGAIVLLSPFGFSPTGEAFNLTMEDVATSTAVALQADKLIFMTEVPGIRENPNDPESPIDTELALADAQRLLAQ
uniref:amino-acid N-acetyltransferase n=1 Tax=Tepidiforma sp. TaxID=2682230 RepID=UPI002ADDA792